jgi:F0F1-type ATP synthase assembly protein I
LLVLELAAGLLLGAVIGWVAGLVRVRTLGGAA